jgi:hypothetical protein
VSTKDWFIRTIALFLVLGLMFGWHEWSDHTYLDLIFGGLVIALFEGEYLLKRVREEQRQNNKGQRQNTFLLERLEILLKLQREEQRQNKPLLESVEEGQRRNALLLERLEAEQQKLKRQQVRTTILIERIVSNTPAAADRMPGDDCDTP